MVGGQFTATDTAHRRGRQPEAERLEARSSNPCLQFSAHAGYRMSVRPDGSPFCLSSNLVSVTCNPPKS